MDDQILEIERKVFITKLVTSESALLYCLVACIFYDVFNFWELYGNQLSFGSKEFILHYSFDDNDTVQVLSSQFKVFVNLKKLILVCLSLHLGYLAMRLGVG